ncbi:COG2426 family protein [Nafulsella turpanensis]|uniref:COG2426 family protein n=1 Tax=Nafulsella turpanensis TaxID=1265690 RepID=UPI00034BB7FA|nr:small multi-drug export protein [Nafulsella turpanensis]
MINDIIYTFLISISPFGEARAGIPYGILNGLNPVVAFSVGLAGNLLIFPLFMFLIDAFNAKLWRFKFYRKQNIRLIRRARKGVGAQVQKYGFWGLMIFVMIPLPTTGAYMGTIAAYIFKLKRKEALLATSIGVVISCMIMAVSTHFSIIGLSLF